MEDLIQKEVVGEVQNLNSPGFYSTIFLTPKPNGLVRKITNLWPLNKLIFSHQFHIETLQAVLAAMQPGHWAISIDLKDAHFYIPVHPRDQKYSKTSLSRTLITHFTL